MAGALALTVQFSGRMETLEMTAAVATGEAKPVRILLPDDQADILDALQLPKPGAYQMKEVTQPSAEVSTHN